MFRLPSWIEQEALSGRVYQQRVCAGSMKLQLESTHRRAGFPEQYVAVLLTSLK